MSTKCYLRFGALKWLQPTHVPIWFGLYKSTAVNDNRHASECELNQALARLHQLSEEEQVMFMSNLFRFGGQHDA